MAMIMYSNPWVCFRANWDVFWLHGATSQRCLEGRRTESARGSWERWTWTSEMWIGVLDPSSGRAGFIRVWPGQSHRLRWVSHLVFGLRSCYCHLDSSVLVFVLFLTRYSGFSFCLGPCKLYGGSDSKESNCHAGDSGLIPGWGRSPGEGNGYQSQYSCLENPMDRWAWWATDLGVTKSQTQLSN